MVSGELQGGAGCSSSHWPWPPAVYGAGRSESHTNRKSRAIISQSSLDATLASAGATTLLCLLLAASKRRGWLNQRGCKSKCNSCFVLMKTNVLARKIHSLRDLALNLSNQTSSLQLEITELPGPTLSSLFACFFPFPSYGFLHNELDGVLRRLAGLHHGDFISIHGDGGNGDALPSQHRGG